MNIIEHYDNLIDENNDPVYDPKPLQDYMNKWDGQRFVDEMHLDENKTVLEIGIGTGRLAIKTAPLCKNFYGIDISPKTIAKAKINLSEFSNVRLICDDFMKYDFSNKFDVIYSSLTFMHIENKQNAIKKIASMLNNNGIFALSIDKNQENFIDMGTYKVSIFPDKPSEIEKYINNANLNIKTKYETEFAHIFIAEKNKLPIISKSPQTQKRKDMIFHAFPFCLL